MSSTLLAQEMTRKVDLVFQDEPLSVVLNELSEKYQIRFAYSRNFTALHQRVFIEKEQVHLNEGLNEIFAQSNVAFKYIGDQYVLKTIQPTPPLGPRPQKMKRLTYLSTPLPTFVRQTSPIYPESPEKLAERQRRLAMQKQLPKISKPTVYQLPGGDRLETTEIKDLYVPPPMSADVEYSRLAQISIWPSVSTNRNDVRKNATNKLSVNLLWATNGGVEGVEVGGFVNTIRQDVKGLQFGGLGNAVKGNVIGTQIGGLFNVNGGNLKGFQYASLFNISGPTDAVQIGGLFNINKGRFAGFQTSGLFNVANGPSTGVQVAGLFNTSKRKAKSQISALFNIAGDVQWGQGSLFLNVAKRVDGFQFGLINVADTIAGNHFGLINIVKHGYNRLELASNETLLGNMSVKMGSHKFYNIFIVGARWDDEYINQGSESIRDRSISWGLGYGFGSAVTFNSGFLINLELLAMHINEKEEWTNELNLLNQMRLTFDFQLGRSTSLFFGPTGNLMISKRFDPDTNTIGSMIMPYTLYDKTDGDTNIKMWIGFSGGFRF